MVADLRACVAEAVLLPYIARQVPSSACLINFHFGSHLPPFSRALRKQTPVLHVEMNSTIERAGWVAEPTGRGTLGLLISCGATIFLCTYSAVHPNLPALDESPWKILKRKMCYMMGCICAPEYFAFLALGDCLLIYKYQRKVRLTKSDTQVEQKEVTLYRSTTLRIQ